MTEPWVVVVEAVSPDGAPFGDHVLDRLMEQVRDCNPSALHTTGRYALQLLLGAESGLEAHALAVDRWQRAVAAVGAPVWHAVRVEVVTLDEFEREWAAAGFEDGPSAMAPPASCGADSDRLLRSVFQDPLTQLPTGELFRSKVEATLRTAQRPGTRHGLLMVQLATRSRPESSHAGEGTLDDLVVLDAAKRLAGILRRGDIMARIDGGTFAILVEGVALQGAAALARRASAAVTNGGDDGLDGPIVSRVGMALSETGWNADRLLAAAAHALEAAKTGSEGWVLFSTEASGPAQPCSEAFEAESCADEC